MGCLTLIQKTGLLATALREPFSPREATMRKASGRPRIEEMAKIEKMDK